MMEATRKEPCTMCTLFEIELDDTCLFCQGKGEVDRVEPPVDGEIRPEFKESQ
jgi:hypothetical protein